MLRAVKDAHEVELLAAAGAAADATYEDILPSASAGGGSPTWRPIWYGC